MFAKLWRPYVIRNFSKSTIWKNVDKPKPLENTPPKQPAQNEGSSNLNIGGVPKMWEKKLLVWTGKYKSLEDVPDRISYDKMGKMKSQIRIKMANWMMVLTLIACFAYAYMGKKAAARGESINKRVLQEQEEIKKRLKAQNV